MEGAIGALPIVEAVGGVAGELDFCEEDVGADGVDGASGDVVAASGSGGHFDEVVLGGAFFEVSLELVEGDVWFDSAIDDGVGRGVDDVPGFVFGECVGGGGLLEVGCGRVDLDREWLLGVEVFKEEGEAFVGGEREVAEDGWPDFLDELVESKAGVGAVGDG